MADRRPVRASGAIEGRARHLPAADRRRPRDGGREGRHHRSRTSWWSDSTRPGPASSTGVLSARGSTNFVHPAWAGFDLREGLAHKLGKPVTYLNDGNAGALWGHFTIFGAEPHRHLDLRHRRHRPRRRRHRRRQRRQGPQRLRRRARPRADSLPEHSRASRASCRECNCGRTGDLESLCSLTAIGRSLLPYFLARYPGSRAGGDRSRCRPPSASAGWPSAATRCAATSSACRRTRSGSSSTR